MIIDIIFILIVLFIIFRLEAKKFPYASIIFILLYIIYIYTGTVMMYYDEYIPKDKVFDNLQFIVRGGFVSAVFAYFLSYIALQRAPLYKKEYSGLSSSKKYAFYFVSIIVVFISLLYLLMIPANPIFAMIKNPSSLAFVREQATTTFNHYGFFDNFNSFFLPLVWLTFLFLNKRIYIIFFYLTLLF